ncbi:cytosolic non-specific dipeptidase-like [Tropilaelaps mercedesae]|uniref:Cytosolic non-specific dipeptidase-like n=1 Tax=Tropilaelaps mercedesae TaxID=418985 RepID=A0A1V9XG37_9ACAR|nr:cytosolic non-specific dipeptidase-like [Tropilaelaps mercedesae]
MVVGGLEAVFKFIEAHETELINRLGEAVAIKSISAIPKHRPEIIKMVNWTKTNLEACGVKCELRYVGEEHLLDNTKVPLPPILLGTLGDDNNKKTVLVYGHLDVQPASQEDGWNSDPFSLTEINDNLYGRGTTDNKGPVVAWINAIEAYRRMRIPLPVNIKFCLEAMEESGSKGLEELLRSMQASEFIGKIDFVCISDSFWLSTRRPCLTYGFRGLCHFGVEIECANKDLHSGSFGGVVYEAMNDLVWLMAQLVDDDNRILIPGVLEDIAELTPEEQQLYDDIDFDLDACLKDAGLHGLVYETKDEFLKARWRYPSLSIHGIEGAHFGTGTKSIIPKRVVGKFSIRVVPNQNLQKICTLVRDYISKLWKRRQSPNRLQFHNYTGCPYLLSSLDNPNLQAGARAIKKVFGINPDYIREGGSIPVALTIEEMTHKTVLLLPLGQSDDAAHSANEKISKRNYIMGSKLLASYIDEISKV